MRATITIDMENAAFEDGNGSGELARILRELARRIDEESIVEERRTAKLRDVNGNTVGEFRVETDDPRDAVMDPEALRDLIREIGDMPEPRPGYEAEQCAFVKRIARAALGPAGGRQRSGFQALDCNERT